MKKCKQSQKLHIGDKGFSLIELVVSIAIMIAAVAIVVPMLYNGPSNKTKQDVSTFDSLIAKNAVYSMAKEDRAMVLAYDDTEGCYYVATGLLTVNNSTNTCHFVKDDTRYFDEKENIYYYLYNTAGDPSTGSGYSHDHLLFADAISHGAVQMNHSTKIYFQFNKAKGSFKKVIITNGNASTNDDAILNPANIDYVKYVYFSIENSSRCCRLYKDTGKHDVFKG